MKIISIFCVAYEHTKNTDEFKSKCELVFCVIHMIIVQVNVFFDNKKHRELLSMGGKFAIPHGASKNGTIEIYERHVVNLACASEKHWHLYYMTGARSMHHVPLSLCV